ELSLVDGQQLPSRTELIEYTGASANGRNAAAIGITTGTGAAIGAAAGGGFGAGGGAAAGAIVGTGGAVLANGHATEVYPESMLTFRLLESVTIFTDRSAQAFQPVQQADYATQRTAAPRPRPAPPYGPVYAPYPYPYGYPYPYYGPYYGPRVS